MRFIDGGGPICHGIRFEREVLQLNPEILFCQKMK